ncbi:ATP-dependent Clp protease ATP-binding subunit [Sinosporangium siamense]|uniref:ATPase AAA n=1 Tax=Sinosporangium siamense TaxID=1367973 RepID=A0A919RQ50_9ACTN|nr:AAA family ATPase [Sinosporangium siamense]GII96599.1 ATPase AAA [Sinosporangium siamense]
MTTSPFGSYFGDDPFRGFETLTGRLFGGGDSWPPSRPSVQRVDIGRLLTGPARELLVGAIGHAAARGAADLDELDLLHAVAGAESTGPLLTQAGADPAEIRARIDAARPATGAAGEPPATLTPSAKRVFLDAQRLSRALGATYIGPEHLLIALAANPGSAAARLLTTSGVSANELQEAVIAAEPIAHRRPPGGAESLTPALDRYSRDLTEEAREGRLDPVVGREDEIEQSIEVLSRRRKNNPVLIGEPGVGKTAIVEGIAQRIVNGAVPDTLKNKRVVALDLSGLIAGSRYRGEFEERMKAVIDEIAAHGDELVVFVDELHTVVGVGAAEGGIDAGDMLKPALARGDLHVVGATTVDEYRKHVERDAVLERRLQPILVPEPGVGDTIAILAGLRDRYEAHHQVRLTDDALSAAANLSDRYVADRWLPDKAIDLVDQASARVRLRVLTPAADARELEERLAELHREKDQAVRGEEYDRAQELRVEIDRLRPELEAARRGRDDVPLVTATDIAEVVSRRTGIPASRLTEEERERLVRLEEHLHRRVVGQEEAVGAVAEAVRRARTGLADPGRPIGGFMFLGPAGVGKTELARSLAEALFGGEDHIVRVDMAEFQERRTVGRLIGAPPGRAGREEAGRLTEAVRRRPHTVVLLERIEKAHPDVMNILLQVLEEGRLTDGQGRTVDFTNTLVIMSGNLGASLILDYEGDTADLREDLMHLLEDRLKPEFVNHVDEIVVFRRLERRQVREITNLLLEHTRRRLRAQGVELEVTENAVDWLAQRGYKPEYGARPLRRTIQRELDNRLSNLVITGEVREGDLVQADVTLTGDLELQVRHRAAPPETADPA